MDVFEKANLETAKIIRNSGLEEKIKVAKKSLEAAEEDLIKFALSIVPTDEIRQTLERGVKENYTIRMKLLDLVSSLDVSTLFGL